MVIGSVFTLNLLGGVVRGDLSLKPGHYNKWAGKKVIPKDEKKIMREVARLVARCGFDVVIASGKQARVYAGEVFCKDFGGSVPKLFEERTFGVTQFYSRWHLQMSLPSFAGTALALLGADRDDALLVKLRGAPCSIRIVVVWRG